MKICLFHTWQLSAIKNSCWPCWSDLMFIHMFVPILKQITPAWVSHAALMYSWWEKLIRHQLQHANGYALPFCCAWLCSVICKVDSYTTAWNWFTVILLLSNIWERGKENESEPIICQWVLVRERVCVCGVFLFSQYEYEKFSLYWSNMEMWIKWGMKRFLMCI